MNREEVVDQYEQVMDNLHDVLNILNSFDFVIEEFENNNIVPQLHDDVIEVLKMRRETFRAQLLIEIDPQLFRYRSMLRHPSLQEEE